MADSPSARSPAEPRPKPDLQSGLLLNWLGGTLTLRSRALLRQAGRREPNLQTDSAHAGVGLSRNSC